MNKGRETERNKMCKKHIFCLRKTFDRNRILCICPEFEWNWTRVNRIDLVCPVMRSHHHCLRLDFVYEQTRRSLHDSNVHKGRKRHARSAEFVCGVCAVHAKSPSSLKMFPDSMFSVFFALERVTGIRRRRRVDGIRAHRTGDESFSSKALTFV